MTNGPEYRKSVLQAALSAREQEVMHYQINIDNYTLALERVGELADPDLGKFAEQLHTLLASEVFEQKKAKIMLDVIRKQVEVLE